MKEIELIGGPLDGAHAQDSGILAEGENILIEDEGGDGVVYTLHDGLLEYNQSLTSGFGRS